MMTRDMHTQAPLAVKITNINPTEGLTRHLRIASPANRPRRTLAGSARRKADSSPTSTHPNQPRVSHCLNDNFCVNVPVQAQRLTRSKRTLNCYQCHQNEQESRETVKILSDSTDFCRLSYCKSCTYCKRAATKERCKSDHCSVSEIKICERCFLCRSKLLLKIYL